MNSRGDVKRYAIHVLLIVLGLVAIVPIYLLLINATRTTEQINTGIKIIPGRDAFFTTTSTITADWGPVTNDILVDWDSDDESATVKYFNLNMGETLKEEFNTQTGVNEKIVIKGITENLQPRLVILNDKQKQIANYDLDDNTVLLAEDGQTIKKGDALARFTAVYESGTVRYYALDMGKTLKEVKNKKTGATEKVVVKGITESTQPRLSVLNDENVIIADFLLKNNTVIYVENRQTIKKGDILAQLNDPPNIRYNWGVLTGRGFQIWQGFGNSAFISITATILSIYFSAMTAYGLQVYRFKGRMALWTVILVVIMLPASLSIIGFYQFMSTLKLRDSYIPLIIPGIAAASTVLFLRQYMMSVLSTDLIDAARIDGANEYRIFNIIILPIMLPALAAQSIFTFVGSWNNFITPFILLSSEKKYTLPMLVQNLRGNIYRAEYGAIYLGIAVSLIPIIVFYSLMSRFIISGLTMGGLKE